MQFQVFSVQVLVRQVPRDPNVSVGLEIEHFFRENHPEHYCTHQVLILYLSLFTPVFLYSSALTHIGHKVHVQT
jgi:hypothetical protein